MNSLPTGLDNDLTLISRRWVSLLGSIDSFMLKPSVLARSLMLTPAGVTNRIDKLEAQGYVTREVSQDDRRVAPIRLTKSGMKSVDALLERHLQREDQLFEALTPAQRRQLEQIMRAIGDPS
jgi:DNA-binding MarR family transcriptional regulator